MKTSVKGLIFLVAHEGVVPAPYRDSVGVWTFGVGHTKAAGDPDPKKMPRKMPGDLGSLEEAIIKAFDLFLEDVVKYEAEVLDAVKVPLEQHEFDALVSFHYNTGGIHRAKVTRLLNEGKRAQAARAMLNWRRPPEIIPRREEEQRLFMTGDYGEERANIWRTDGRGKILWSNPVRQLDGPKIESYLGKGSVRHPNQEEGQEPGSGPGKKLTADKILAGMAVIGALVAAAWKAVTG